MEPDLPLIGMGRELSRVAGAIRNRESLLVLGPAGAGKTKILKTAAAEQGKGIAYVAYVADLHQVLIRLAEALFAAGHRAIGRKFANVPDVRRWLGSQTSVHLRGLLWTALEAEPFTIVLDGVDGAGARTYRFVQRIYHTRGVAVIASARDGRALEMLGRLFWDPRLTLQLRPLQPPEALELFERSVRRLRLPDLDLEDFRRRVLDTARGNPGEIVEMCRLAADPQYWSGRHIKFAPLRIDAYTHLLA
jgi:hypothetical protein